MCKLHFARFTIIKPGSQLPHYRNRNRKQNTQIQFHILSPSCEKRQELLMISMLLNLYMLFTVMMLYSVNQA